MDIEWGKDGTTGKLYILQARPETVQSRAKATPSSSATQLRQRGEVLAEGRSIGQKIGAGPARVISRAVADMEPVQPATCWSPT
jgi:pyruvate,water dikinase